MKITNIREVTSANINWGSVGRRIKYFREKSCITHVELSRKLGWAESTLISFESGTGDRQSTNNIWHLSNTLNLSLNWLLNGIGAFCDQDPPELLPETLLITQGAGIRKTVFRSEAEDGAYSNECLEFVMAIDKFKTRNNLPYPRWTQIYEIMMALGYRKAVPARIAPLGHIVKHQLWAEKLKQLQEIDEEIKKQEDKEAKIKQWHTEARRKEKASKNE